MGIAVRVLWPGHVLYHLMFASVEEGIERLTQAQRGSMLAYFPFRKLVVCVPTTSSFHLSYVQ